LRGNIKIMFTYYSNEWPITIYLHMLRSHGLALIVGALVDINVLFVIRLHQKGLLQRVTLWTNC